MDRHPDVVVIAAGVSSTSARSLAEFARERELVRDVLRKCSMFGKTVVFLSTASHAMYGSTTDPVSENTSVRPVSPYGRHKRGLEQLVMESDVDWLILRISHVIGPGQPAHQLLPALIEQIRSGAVVVHTGAHRDLIDVADLIDCVDALLRRDVRQEIVHVASGRANSIEWIVEALEHRLETHAERLFVPGPVVRTLVSTDKLRGFAPDIVARTDEPRYPEHLLDRLLHACDTWTP
ncbi:NAD-dependent epimerase/dehydratase family protein [Kibdelosporangium persicum]|uniref:Nucleoside-diphosphate-sugar epimerase n=1 Tax=Kibdelosporangium persicum TaxID=2698649 RepID=A0ABX2FHV5_9PSEU|nr:NAD-dependent epimerase/dehydratase family protein [Kibdelosporangium persicum]NRN70975.1 Nucleoside-diphosphate-sugar epimerase [Kibdelosporangium persicum]